MKTHSKAKAKFFEIYSNRALFDGALYNVYNITINNDCGTICLFFSLLCTAAIRFPCCYQISVSKDVRATRPVERSTLQGRPFDLRQLGKSFSDMEECKMSKPISIFFLKPSKGK